MLNTEMSEYGNLDVKEVFMLGDSNGLNIGRVFEYNTISFFLSSYIPLEENCYLKFVFPAKLKIDSALEALKGEGIFDPGTTDGQIPKLFWSANYVENSVSVQGCLLED